MSTKNTFRRTVRQLRLLRIMITIMFAIMPVACPVIGWPIGIWLALKTGNGWFAIIPIGLFFGLAAVDELPLEEWEASLSDRLEKFRLGPDEHLRKTKKQVAEADDLKHLLRDL